jgi:serine/threonine protein kinase/formylglycine-generating enzyme required for sulfatase activity
VAIKLLHAGVLAAEDLTRFQMELGALSAFGHGNVAIFYDAGLWQGRPYLVLEWVEGGVSITDFCQQHELPLRARLDLFLQACAGIQHAHERGIVHCDVKPANLLVGTREPSVVKVIDFGLARALGAAAASSVAPRIAPVVGTVAYLAPEQVSAPDVLDLRTDVHALGLVLFELLTGERAHAEDALAPLEIAGRLLLVAAGVDERPSDRCGEAIVGVRARDLRGPLDWIVAKSLAVDRSQRFGSVAELAADVSRFLSGEVVTAGPAPVGYRVRGWLRQNRAAVASAALVIVSLVAGTAAAAAYAAEAALAAQAAESARLAAVHAATRFDLLADGARYRQAIEAADSLWPVGPELVPAIDRWLHEFGEPLAARLPIYRATIAELSASASPVLQADPTEEEPSRSPFHPIGHRLQHLAIWRAVVEPLGPVWNAAPAALGPEAFSDYSASMEILAASLSLPAEAGAQLTPSFPQDRDLVLWQQTRELVAGIEAMTGDLGLLARIRQRRSDCLAAADRSLHVLAAVAAWTAAAARVAADPRFPGVLLQPIAGLLPLGPDPQSGLEEFAHLDSGAIPLRDPGGELVLPDDFGIVLVLLPPARTWIGAQSRDPRQRNYDPWALPNEGPVHEITLPSLLVSKFELTIAQSMRYSHVENGGRENLLSHDISMEVALELGRKAGLMVLTEDAWEYACRAGSTTPWWCGEDTESLSSRPGVPAAANLASLEFGPALWAQAWEAPDHRDGYRMSAPPAALRANAFGLHHVHGNGAEVCVGRHGGAVLRGASCFSSPAEARSAARCRVATASLFLGPTVRFGRRLEP